MNISVVLTKDENPTNIKDELNNFYFVQLQILDESL